MTSRHARVTWHAAKMADRIVPAYFSYFFPGLFTPFSHPTVFPSRAGKFYHSYLFPQESVIRTRLLAFQLWRVLKCRFFHDVSCFDLFFRFLCALPLLLFRAFVSWISFVPSNSLVLNYPLRLPPSCFFSTYFVPFTVSFPLFLFFISYLFFS